MPCLYGAKTKKSSVMNPKPKPKLIKWKNKYRIDTARAVWWDYRNAGIYFITICTQGREHFFGDCVDGKMRTSTIGLLVQGIWYEIPRRYPTIELGEFVVMPNHIHGILIQTDTSQSVHISNVVGGFKSACTRHINLIASDVGFAWQRLFWDVIVKTEKSFHNIQNYIKMNPKKWKKDLFFTTS